MSTGYTVFHHVRPQSLSALPLWLVLLLVPTASLAGFDGVANAPLPPPLTDTQAPAAVGYQQLPTNEGAVGGRVGPTLAGDRSTWLASIPEALSRELTVAGDRMSIAEAISRHRDNAERIAEGNQRAASLPAGPQLEAVRARIAEAEADQTAIEDALGQKLQAAADYLGDARGFATNSTTRRILSLVNENYLALQVAAAGLDQANGPNAVFVPDLAAMAGEIVEASRGEVPVRFQFITSEGGHYVGGDVYIDPEQRVLSVAVVDSVDWGLDDLYDGIEDGIESTYRSVVTQYSTDQQTLCRGCRQFSLEFVDEMSRYDIHAEPLGRLADAVVAQPWTPHRLRDIVTEADGSDDQIWLNRRQGELPPSFYRLANAQSGWNAYAAAREAFLGETGNEAIIRSGMAELETTRRAIDADRVAREIARFGKDSKLTRINLAVDERRRSSIERLATLFESGRGADLLIADDARRRQVLERAAADGTLQQERFRARLRFEQQEVDRLSRETRPPPAAHQEARAIAGRPANEARLLLDRIAARDADEAPPQAEDVLDEIASATTHDEVLSDEQRKRLVSALLLTRLRELNVPTDELEDAWSEGAPEGADREALVERLRQTLEALEVSNDTVEAVEDRRRATPAADGR